MAGAGLLFLLVWLTAGCDLSPDPVSDPELEAAREIGLADGARLHRVILGGRGSEEHVLPALIRATPGDGVEFFTVDHRVHTISFPLDSLSSSVAEFLAGTGQNESPPLVHRGSRFILLLEDAPEGRYAFVSRGHGGEARGTIEVRRETDSLATRSF
jgi:plastocyanin